jgi:hypothetical protein
MPEPILNPLDATLSPSGTLRPVLRYRIRAQLGFINAHIFILSTFLRFVQGPDQLVRFEPSPNITRLAPDTIESDLPDNKSRLIKMRNQVVLVTYDLATNTREVREAYAD